MLKAKRAHLPSLEATAVVVFLFSANPATSQSDQPVLAHKYVAQAEEAKSFVEAYALRIRTKDGRIILGGKVYFADEQTISRSAVASLCQSKRRGIVGCVTTQNGV
jgi:hypothetical protein